MQVAKINEGCLKKDSLFFVCIQVDKRAPHTVCAAFMVNERLGFHHFPVIHKLYHNFCNLESYTTVQAPEYASTQNHRQYYQPGE